LENEKLPIALISASILLVIVRFFTGTAYPDGDETAYFIIKTTPNAKIERNETPARPITQDILLYGDEFEPPFGDECIVLMKLVPAVSGTLLMAGF
jgi:hypothetical protein